MEGISQGHTFASPSWVQGPCTSLCPSVGPATPLSPTLISNLKGRGKAEEGVDKLGQVEDEGHEGEVESRRPSHHLLKAQTQYSHLVCIICWKVG